MLGWQWYWQAVLLHSCHGVRLSWTAQAPQGDQQQKAASHLDSGGERNSCACEAFVHFFSLMLQLYNKAFQPSLV